MEFGVKKTIEANEVSNELASNIYPNTERQKDKIDNDFVTLEKLCSVFAGRATLHKETANKKYTCYIEKKAFDAFVQFANETYQSRHHEATGLIVGYYLHDKNNPDSKFIVGTNFLRATGPTSPVTCEFSYQDSIDHSNYYNVHKLLPLVWIHSHPDFGAFYSGTDDATLQNYYYANHQTGVVVDNIRHEVLGYKIYDGKKQEEDVYIFDLDKSNSNQLALVYSQFKKKKKEQPVIDTHKGDDSKKKGEEIKTLETKGENLENEIVTLKNSEKAQRHILNVIIWTLCVLFVFFLVLAGAFFVNFKHANDLNDHIIALEDEVQQLDSIRNAVAVTPAIIPPPPTIIKDTDTVPKTTEKKTAKTEVSKKRGTTKSKSETVQKTDTTDKKGVDTTFKQPVTDNTKIKKDTVHEIW